MKTTKNYRFSEKTIKQIEWLEKLEKTTATRAIEAAVDEKYNREFGRMRLKAVQVKKDRYNLVAGDTVIATINQSVLDATKGHKADLLSEEGADPSAIGVVFLATAIAKKAWVGWNVEGVKMLSGLNRKEEER